MLLLIIRIPILFFCTSVVVIYFLTGGALLASWLPKWHGIVLSALTRVTLMLCLGIYRIPVILYEPRLGSPMGLSFHKAKSVQRSDGGAMTIISNHTSYLDIPVHLIL